MPGTQEKLLVMAERIRSGLPLWHPADRDDLAAKLDVVTAERDAAWADGDRDKEWVASERARVLPQIALSGGQV